MKKRLFQSGIPVMVAEMGSLKTEKRQDIWLTEAFHAMDTLFHEIKAIVFFNSDQDMNVPQSNKNDTLDWTLADPQLTFTALKNDLNHDNTQITIEELSIASTSHETPLQSQKMFDNIKGINFAKGQHWFKNYHTLTKRELNRDFYQLKSLGINTIKRYGPTVYVRNILSVAAAHSIKIHYSFWVPETLNFINDEPSTSALAEKILKTVEDLKDKEIITAWNIGNGIAEQLQHQYYKPALLYHQKAYILWLKNLVKQIKAIDPERPVTLDVIVTGHLLKDIQFLHAELPEIDAFGLIVYGDKGMDQIEKLQVPYFYSYIDVNQYLYLKEKSVGTFITGWQDTKTKTEVTFDGVIDHWGRHKQDYHLLARQWGNKSSQSNLPSVKILRPALPTLPGTLLKYHALVYSNDQWVLADSLHHDLQFEWHLIKNDAQGNSRFMTEIGRGTHLSFEIPEDPFTYTLYLVASKGNDVITDQSVLHTPLYSKQ